MTRKKLKTVVLVVLASSLGGCASLPNLASFSDGVGAESGQGLAELRKLVSPCEDESAEAGSVPMTSGKQPIDLEVRVLYAYPADTKGAFFAGASGDKLIAGRLKADREAFVQSLLDLSGHGVDLQARPRLQTSDGRPARLDVGFNPALIGGALTGSWCWSPSAFSIEITPTVRDDGNLMLSISAAMSRIKTAKATQGTFEEREYERTVSDKTQVVCQPGESLVVGGLKQKRTEIQRESVPFLSCLPVAGPSMTYVSHKAIEEELLVVVTPIKACR
jgi:hypothetical protein